MLLTVDRMLDTAPMANCSTTRSSTWGSAAVPLPVVTAATTASTSSLEIHTRAAGRPPWSKLNKASDSVNHGLASHTRPRTRRKPCQVVTALAHKAAGVIGGPPGAGGGDAAAAVPKRRPRPPPGPPGP